MDSKPSFSAWLGEISRSFCLKMSLMRILLPMLGLPLPGWRA